MRRLALAVCFTVVLAGCASTPPMHPATTTTTTTTTHPDCATTPDYDRQPVPDLPTNLTRESATQFAKTHAEALAWNDAYRDADFGLAVNGEASIVNETADGYIVYVSGGMTYKNCGSTAVSVADGMFAASYFINNSTAVRLRFPTNRTDDPREHGGESVAEATTSDPDLG